MPWCSTTFYHIDLGEWEADGLGHAFNVRFQLSFWQRGEFIKQRGDVVGVDGHQNLHVVEGETRSQLIL